jgi:hypothetical protein
VMEEEGTTSSDPTMQHTYSTKSIVRLLEIIDTRSLKKKRQFGL